MKPAGHAKLDHSPRDQLAIDWPLKSDEPGPPRGPSEMLTLHTLRVLRASGA